MEFRASRRSWSGRTAGSGGQRPDGTAISGVFACFAAGALAAASIIAGCAGQIPPPGGPLDSVAPRVIRSYPDTNAVRVRPDHVFLEFDEYVARQSVEEAIFFSPFLGPLEFDWSGREVTVRFRDSLRANTTYVVSLGTDVRDVRAGNRMGSSFALAFSTGDSIDQGSVSGRVIDDRPEGIMVTGYLLERHGKDTLDPARTMPDYVVQTGQGGKFHLTNLALGTYRLFALQDEYKNFTYDPGIDRYGVLPGDVRLSPEAPRAFDALFRLSKEDTSKPFLSSARAESRHLVRFRFSKPLDTLAGPTGVFELSDTVSGTLVPLRSVFIPRSAPATGGLVTAVPLDSAGGYRLTVRGVSDAAGNPIDTSNASFAFAGTNLPDTLRPAANLSGITDSTRSVSWWTTLDLQLPEPVRQAPLEAGTVLLDSARHPVEAARLWLTPVDLRIVPRRELMGNAWYTLRVTLDSLEDLQGNRGQKDSTVVVRFKTRDVKTTGVIDGAVSERRPPPDSGKLYVTARSLQSAATDSRTLVLKTSGPFRLERVIEGPYALEAFRDVDRSGAFSPGRPYPFLPSEPFTVGSDTVKVRARWTVEGVSLRFP